MATKKKIEETTKDTKEEAITITESDIAKIIARAKEEAIKEFEKEYSGTLKSQAKEVPMTKAQRSGFSDGYIPETDEQLAYANELVEVIAPLDANAPEEINLSVNGKTIQILRGYRVNIPRKYALVLENMIDQQMASKRYQDSIREQVTNVEY